MNAILSFRIPGSIIVSLLAMDIAMAQTLAPPPPKLEPLPEIPAPPGVSVDEALEPQVTISRREGEIIEEARANGKLKWVRVTPLHGRPYYLVPDPSGEFFTRRDSLETGLKVPLWVLFSF